MNCLGCGEKAKVIGTINDVPIYSVCPCGLISAFDERPRNADEMRRLGFSEEFVGHLERERQRLAIDQE